MRAARGALAAALGVCAAFGEGEARAGAFEALGEDRAIAERPHGGAEPFAEARLVLHDQHEGAGHAASFVAVAAATESAKHVTSAARA